MKPLPCDGPITKLFWPFFIKIRRVLCKYVEVCLLVSMRDHGWPNIRKLVFLKKCMFLSRLNVAHGGVGPFYKRTLPKASQKASKLEKKRKLRHF